jgi:hypothetical protein
MRGGGASEYGTALYGAAGQQQAGHGNMIAMNQVGGGGDDSIYVKYKAGYTFKVKIEKSDYKLKKDESITDKNAYDEFNKPDLKGGRKSNMNFMMVPKMFMRMTRSRKHRRASKRHHGKSRKHKK